jgi:ribosomal protein S18 acetylase RimI-like enzyme
MSSTGIKEGTMRIRRVNENEAPLVLELWRANGEESVGGPVFLCAENILEHIRGNATHPDAICLVAEEDGQLVGFVTAQRTTHPTLPGAVGEIEELYVQPPARRAGVGRALVDGAVEHLREQGADVFKTQADLEREGALAFLKAIGWENDMTVFSLYDD